MRLIAIAFGLFFLCVGIAGFTSRFTTEDGYLLHVFKVNLPFNLLHLITGLCALLVGFFHPYACRLYFQIVGLFYAIQAILGFLYSKEILGIFSNNIPNTWMHVIVATFALVTGYGSDIKDPKE